MGVDFRTLKVQKFGCLSGNRVISHACEKGVRNDRKRGPKGGSFGGVEKGGSNRGRGQNRGGPKVRVFKHLLVPIWAISGVSGGPRGVQRGVQRVDFGQISGRGGRKGGFTSFAV